MELRQDHLLAEYRLLFMQPDPESGERVCVGIFIDGDLLYDREFSRARCISSAVNVDQSNVYLESLRDRVASRPAIAELVGEYAPLFSCSSARSVTLPVTSEKKLSLFEHFVKRKARNRTRNAAARREHFVNHLHQFALTGLNLRDAQVIENASASDVIGREDVDVELVAIALRTETHTIILDGIDLNSSSSGKQARTQIAQVSHVFWRYKRFALQERLDIKRVACIFNGNSHLRPELRDAHDFALDELRGHADLTLDASNQDAKHDVRSFLDQALSLP
jgi:hypothetical protein